MWIRLLAFNSFVIMPACFIFLVYSTGRAIVFGDWKLFVTAVIVFIFGLISEVILATRIPPW